MTLDYCLDKALPNSSMYFCGRYRLVLSGLEGVVAIRLTLLVDSPNKSAHGNAASRLALGLAQTGEVEPTLLCYGGDPAPSWLPPEVQVERLEANRVSRAVPPLVRYLRAEQPDVLITRQIHANFFGLAAAWLARTPPAWRGKLVLVQDHPVALSHAANWRDNKWLARMTYRFADGIISPSPTVREDTLRWCGMGSDAVAVVPNAIPPFLGPFAPPPHPWLRDGEPPVFVHTSFLYPWKRLDLLIESFAQVSKTNDVRLLIVGSGRGQGRKDADELIARLGLGDRAQTLGWVEDPLQYAARACAFVLPSDEEGFAQVLTEAMSVGCPVITTDAMGGGPRYVTDNGHYGVLVPRGDRAALAEAMRSMLDEATRERYAQLGLERVKAMSPIACATALIEFLAKQLRVQSLPMLHRRVPRKEMREHEHARGIRARS
jgi:glycosyltransferase involved in cell wall biosynthesis